MPLRGTQKVNHVGLCEQVPRSKCDSVHETAVYAAGGTTYTEALQGAT